jgi:hydrogenase maturation factor
VPTQAAERCLAELHGLGYAQAARIGRVVARENVLEPVRLISTTLPN